MKTIDQMTRKEILAVKPREDYRTPIVCKGFILIPSRREHDSGYNKMEIVAADGHNYPICNCSMSCDVINLINFDIYTNPMKRTFKENEIVHRWHIDCLPKSGLLCFSTWDEHQTEIGVDCSGIDIKGYVSQKENTN